MPWAEKQPPDLGVGRAAHSLTWMQLLPSPVISPIPRVETSGALGALTVCFTPPPNSAPTGPRGGLLYVPAAPLFFGSGRGCHCCQATPQYRCGGCQNQLCVGCSNAASACRLLLLYVLLLLPSSSKPSFDEPPPWKIVLFSSVLEIEPRAMSARRAPSPTDPHSCPLVNI